MIVEIGHFALILAACVALVQGVLPLAGTINDNQRWQALAKPAATLQFLLIAFSFAVLAHGALTDDFSIKYIAGHSNSLLPTQYKFASVWGGHEGSLLEVSLRTFSIIFSKMEATISSTISSNLSIQP